MFGHSEMTSIGANLSQLVYKFDVSRPWQYFRQGLPFDSLVEKGRRSLKLDKFKKVYVAKRKMLTRCKNAPFKDLSQLEFTCCDDGCLLLETINSTRRIVRQQQNMIYQRR